MGFHRDLIDRDLHAPSNLKVENNSASPIAKLRAVKFDGMGTAFIQIELADGSVDVVRGITQDLIDNTSPINAGYITSLGLLSEVDTSSFSVNDDLYAGPSGVLQIAPNGPVIATVLVSDATQGIIYVQIPPVGTTLDDKVRVTATDTNPDYLSPKLVPGSRMDITPQNLGGNENLLLQPKNQVGTGLVNKAGVVAAASFTGSPRKATITFSSPMPNASYSITVTGTVSRSWTYESRTTGGFVINANAAAALSGDVSWKAEDTGESN